MSSENNIKMDFRETGYEDRKRMEPSQNRRVIGYYALLVVFRRFGGTYCLQFQDQRVSSVGKRLAECTV
jgi:hypothetical protein